MKKMFLSIIVLITLTLLSSACVTIGRTNNTASIRGTGDMVSRDFQVDNFYAIDISGAYVVTYTQSQASSLTVEMQENLFQHLDVEVRNGTLYVSSNRTFNVTAANMPRLYIYTSSLQEASFAGAVEASNWDIISTQNFTLNAAGGSSINIGLDVEHFELGVAGGTSIELYGNATTAYISGAGGLSVSAERLQTRDATVSVAGAGNVTIAVSDNLNATIAGVGTIRYIGNPTVTRSVTGLGSVRRQD